MKICSKHDVAHQENGTCWCCDLEKQNEEQKQKKQKDKKGE